MAEKICEVHVLGLVAYQEAWELQNAWAAEIAAGKRAPTLMLLEHPHAYTFGRRGRAENLLWEAEELARRGVTVHWVDRGGDVTYHGPGQLVGYPLLPLGRPVERPGGPARLPQADYVGYVRKLEQVIIAALGELGVRGEQLEGLTGVWARVGGRPAKIAAIGVKVDARGVSRHGFALNVDPEMRYWEGIIGCGLQDYASTSLAEISHPAPEMERVRALVSASFGQVFDYKMEKSTQSWRTV